MLEKYYVKSVLRERVRETERGRAKVSEWEMAKKNKMKMSLLKNEL